ncbi:patatin-like phospholipase family protein [Mesorhizobium sp. ORM8.1]
MADSSEGPSGVFGPDFMREFGDRLWAPSEADMLAAHELHIELISRIATQPLGYASGVEKRALGSIFEIFGKAREITKGNPKCQTFETIVWHVFNAYVRPFTAKWHAKSESGELNALDSSDLFRAELEVTQNSLVALDNVLTLIRGTEGISAIAIGRPINQSLKREMERLVGWRPMGEVRTDGASALSSSEEAKVRERQSWYGISARDWAAGLALSGGGIRSATFAMGVLVALSKRGLLEQFDYLSTVSGGGYTGSFLTQLLGGTISKENLSLRQEDLPFKRTEGESELLQRIRQGASYLSGSGWERFAVAMAQAQGVLLNVFFVFCFVSSFAYFDYVARQLVTESVWRGLALASSAGLVGLFLGMPIARSWAKRSLAGKDRSMALIGALLLLPSLWCMLGIVHWASNFISDVSYRADSQGINQLFLIWTVIGSTVILFAVVFSYMKILRPMILSMTSLISIIVIEAIAYDMFIWSGVENATVFVATMVIFAIFLFFVIDINTTSLHGYYRLKLSQSFLIDDNFNAATALKLGNVNGSRTFFPIWNCALNVPGSTDPRMRGRQADLFSFTPVSAGATLVGHSSIQEWEQANPTMDLATAMALSGAALSPQMGLRTSRYGSFWLTLLNLRLGAWLKNPGTKAKSRKFPNARNLFQELFATANEHDAFLQISDGGHIENLGVYELLRRRCRFIVAVDGEQDEKMTFNALTNLQRLAYIDHGIIVEANLEDLRITEKGFSRSHFRFCRIRYPLGNLDQHEEIGYLVYLKLSLTGNEGEFIRRYKLDEPAFPHQSTVNQFFTEVQFEAYRALGEHVGDKMFLTAITGLPEHEKLDLERWFQSLGYSFLDPLI